MSALSCVIVDFVEKSQAFRLCFYMEIICVIIKQARSHAVCGPRSISQAQRLLPWVLKLVQTQRRLKSSLIVLVRAAL